MIWNNDDEQRLQSIYKQHIEEGQYSEVTGEYIFLLEDKIAWLQLELQRVLKKCNNYAMDIYVTKEDMEKMYDDDVV
ncbi:hypothetical protein [Scytonema sp. NUACC26]|uniref:hypothetical protein n=1 Tax=Scytonema sp. NUACC26 TaxID=3140176 RepID=UPI0034DB86DE